MSDLRGGEAITASIRGADSPAICAYVTAGYPNRDAFPPILRSIAESADVVEIGVPFSDPMADGLTIQNASRLALDEGVNLGWLFDILAAEDLAAPHLLMGYYNPFLAYGLERLADSMDRTGTAGLIVPDLPIEESGPLEEVLVDHDLALVQLVTPTTPIERMARLAASSGGFLYAVTMTGVTGGQAGLSADDLEYLRRVRATSELPVLAGFGIRGPEQVKALAPYVDGVVVGSALIDAIDRGEDPARFLDGLRPAPVSR